MKNNLPRAAALLSISAGLLVHFSAAGSRAAVAFTSLDVPGASGTFINNIDGNRVVGSYLDNASVRHGFLWDGASFVTLDPPGSTRTEVNAVDPGSAGGFYDGADGRTHAFVWNGSTYSTLDPSSATSSLAIGVSSAGSTVVGRYMISPSTVTHAFIWDGSSFTTLDSLGLSGPVTTGSNGHKAVGYYYSSMSGHPEHGFLWDGSSTTLLDVPGEAETQPNAISSAGDVTGDAVDAAGHSHGFVWDGLSYSTFDPPGSKSTGPVGISGGNVAGSFSDINGSHGFFFNGSSSYSIFNVPGSTTQTVTAISGDIVVGSYRNGTNPWHGFMLDVSALPEPTGALTLLPLCGFAFLGRIRRGPKRGHELIPIRKTVPDPRFSPSI